MFIGSVDKIETSKLKRIKERQLKEARRKSKYKSAAKLLYSDIADTIGSQFSDCESEGREELTLPSTLAETAKLKQMRISLPTVARISNQYQVSDRCAVAIASVVLVNVEIISKEETSEVIDK